MLAFNLSTLFLYLYLLVHWIIIFYSWIIFLAAALSFFPGIVNTAFAKIAYWIFRLARPVFSFFQRFIPPIAGIDFSPLVALLVLNLIDRGFYNVIMRLFY
ncbi:YggT family protein [Oenococcus alcoholitolerans]|uniref:Cell division protein n=1 Tax=Oenococcus alcoholitolerans TaxID=931074 RepID=A0ABR4XQH8_9LACO|nr:hypothetical protein Q757_05975 [Oenococcus alcoholitolerans]